MCRPVEYDYHIDAIIGIVVGIVVGVGSSWVTSRKISIVPVFCSWPVQGKRHNQEVLLPTTNNRKTEVILRVSLHTTALKNSQTNAGREGTERNGTERDGQGRTIFPSA